MHADLHEFLCRLAGTVALTLAPVVFIAFLSMPISLNRHPGEVAIGSSPSYTHLT